MENKPKSLKRANGDVVAINEIYAAAKRDAAVEVEHLQQQLNEQKQLSDLSSMIKLKDADEAQSRFMRVMFLRNAKETLKKEGRWTSFCRENNIDIKQADYEISKVGDFRDEVLLKFGVATGFELNKIRYLTYDDSQKLGVAVKGDKLFFNDEEIPFVPEEVQAVLEKIKSDHKKQIEKYQNDVLAQKRIVSQKNDLLEKNAHELTKWEVRAKGRGLSPDEDAFEKQIESFRITFSGHMSRIEPTKIEELQSFAAPRDEITGLHPPTTVTPCMRASYISLIEWMLMRVNAARDTAVEMYGADMKESEWKFPNLKSGE